MRKIAAQPGLGEVNARKMSSDPSLSQINELSKSCQSLAAAMPLYSPSWDEGLRCDTIRLAEMTQAEKAHMQALEFYAMRDPSERLAYGIKEVVHYLQIPSATLHSWIRG
jgi:hypothetical protein